MKFERHGPDNSLLTAYEHFLQCKRAEWAGAEEAEIVIELVLLKVYPDPSVRHADVSNYYWAAESSVRTNSAFTTKAFQTGGFKAHKENSSVELREVAGRRNAQGAYQTEGGFHSDLGDRFYLDSVQHGAEAALPAEAFGIYTGNNTALVLHVVERSAGRALNEGFGVATTKDPAVPVRRPNTIVGATHHYWDFGTVFRLNQTWG